MHLNNVIFVESLPKLDLHGENSETARVLIDDFIKDSIRQKHNIVCIIHGVGAGIIRQTTKDTLSRNKKVIDFKTYYYNQGCTIVEIEV